MIESAWARLLLESRDWANEVARRAGPGTSVREAALKGFGLLSRACPEPSQQALERLWPWAWAWAQRRAWEGPGQGGFERVWQSLVRARPEAALDQALAGALADGLDRVAREGRLEDCVSVWEAWWRQDSRPPGGALGSLKAEVLARFRLCAWRAGLAGQRGQALAAWPEGGGWPESLLGPRAAWSAGRPWAGGVVPRRWGQAAVWGGLLRAPVGVYAFDQELWALEEPAPRAGAAPGRQNAAPEGLNAAPGRQNAAPEGANSAPRWFRLEADSWGVSAQAGSAPAGRGQQNGGLALPGGDRLPLGGRLWRWRPDWSGRVRSWAQAGEVLALCLEGAFGVFLTGPAAGSP